MNKNILIVLGGAVLVAVLMAVLVQLMLGGKEEKVAVKEEPKSFILVAAKDLSIAHELGDGDLKWQSWPKSNLFAGAVVRKDDQKASEALEGRLRREVSKGEPVLKSYLIGETKGNFVAASLEKGQRAVSIQVSATTMVAGFIAPGDFVDVVLTYRQSINLNADEDPLIEQMIELNLEDMATETILENVRVLAIDQRATQSDDDKIRVGKTVTLALDVEHAERIILAQEIGDLTLILRGIGDDSPIKREWPIISDQRLVNLDDDLYEKYSIMKNDTGIQAKNVRIYSGEAVQVIPAK